MEEFDQVLQILMDEDKHQGYFFDLKYILKKAHSDLQRDEIIRIVGSMEAKGLVSTPARKTKGAQLLVKVNPSAYDYFKNREERKAILAAEEAEAAAKALEESEERSWNIKMAFWSYVAGLISGLALMWSMVKFFP
ncbi:MAG TPA: hypothetical protein VN631_16575 [Negativicutes bacterium]|nr:hypothetical protein [Negativicutes bacterium]